MLFDTKKAGVIALMLVVGIIVDATLWLWLSSSHAVASGEVPKLYFLDVGQGDSSLIELASGQRVLIDGGPDGKKLLENLEKILPENEHYIDLVVMTHPQLDHFGGFIELLKRYEVGMFIGNGRTAQVAAYPELIKQLRTHDVSYLQLTEGDAITIGDSKLKILGPSKDDIVSGELNDTCVVVLLDTPQVKALYTGDIGENVEAELVKKYDIDVDVLKVGHHGSRFSSSDLFLSEVTPAVAAIEVGKNTYGHPTKVALDRLEKFGARVTRADKDGIIEIVPAADTLQVFGLQP
jgi:competence protein ComEC